VTELGRLAAVMGVLSLFSFGGANGALPQLHADVVDRYHWLTSTEFARYWALGGLVPGPTLTVSALIGYTVAGFAGAAVASAALFVPSGMIVYALGSAWERVRGNPWRDRIAAGFAPVILGLIWAGSLTLVRGAIDGWAAALIAFSVATLMLATRVNRILLVVAAGVVGYVWFR
jgi:chromate transporter